MLAAALKSGPRVVLMNLHVPRMDPERNGVHTAQQQGHKSSVRLGK